MSRGMFGWSYPPGAENDPNAPWNQEEPPCEVCGKDVDDCICPECKTCGEVGALRCYKDHGMRRSAEQVRSKRNFNRRCRKAEEEERRLYEAEEEERSLAKMVKLEGML